MGCRRNARFAVSSFIKVDASYPTHPKTLRLRRLLGAGAEWLPIRLWLWCADHVPDGRLQPGDVELACDWSGEDGKLEAALRSVGFLDADGSLHGWMERSGAVLASIEAKRQRDRAAVAARRGPSSDCRGDVAAMSQRHPATSSPEKEKEKEKLEHSRASQAGPAPAAPPPAAPAGTPPGEPAAETRDHGQQPEAKVPRADVDTVYARYRQVWACEYKPTAKRTAKIRARLQEFGLERVLVAIDNSRRDPWEDRPKYRDLAEHVLRSQEQTDRWVNNPPHLSKAPPGPAPPPAVDPRQPEERERAERDAQLQRRLLELVDALVKSGLTDGLARQRAHEQLKAELAAAKGGGP